MVESITNRKSFFFNIFLFVNPFLIFFNQNIGKFNSDKTFIFFQIAIIFLIIIATVAYLLFLIGRKFNNNTFGEYFKYLLILNFFMFFHSDVKMLFPNGRFGSEYSLILLLILSITFIINFDKRKILTRILFFFVLINFFYYFLSIIYNFEKSDIVKKKFGIEYEIDTSSQEENIYLIINDEATSLELFEKYYKDFDKKKLINNFQQYGYEYVKGSRSSYNQTELTFTAMLYLDYFLDENSKKYKNIKNFYPQNLKYNYEQMPLIKLLNGIGYKFYFIGNTRGNCETYVKKNCLIRSDKFIDLFQEHEKILEVFLIRSPYMAIYNKVSEKIRRFFDIPLYNNNYLNNDAIDKFINNIDLENYPKKSFFLIHNLYPHSPYIYNKDCSQKNIEKTVISTLNTNKAEIGTGYYDNYICSMKKTLEFIKFLEKHDKQAIVIIQADHGKYFSKKNKSEKLEIFNLVKKSNYCTNKISNEIDNVNAVRYLIDCATKLKINLLRKKTFWGPYIQSDKNWGKLERIN